MTPIQVISLPDRARAKVVIGTVTLTLGTADVDALIAALGMQRAAMQPIHPLAPDDEEPTVTDTSVSFDVRSDPVAQRTLLRMRHGCFGWIAWELRPDAVAQLSKALAAT